MFTRQVRMLAAGVEMNVKTIVAAVFSAIGFDAFIDEAQIATK